MRFAFKVDAEGHVAEARTASSTIGHRALEQCLIATVASTQFPKPAGRAQAEFAWGLSVEPATARTFEAGSPKLMTALVRKQARELYQSCELRRRRARFKITAYIAAGGRVLSAGAVPLRDATQDQVDCVLDEFATWHMPKVKKATKVSFDLR